jgi:phosphohistidine phosphatase SixA
MLRFVVVLVAALATTGVGATEAAWALLREGGQVVLLRHAIASGTVEPSNFDIDKCATQRNLSERGKQQARKIGSLFAARAAPIDRVLSSRYCRSLATADIAFEDNEAEKFAQLDRLSDDPAEAKAQDAAVMREIEGFAGSGNLVLVTHAENIKALTGMAAREGEAIVVRVEDGSLRVLGKIIFN